MQGLTNNLRIMFIRLMRREHVIVGGNDGDIIAQHTFQRGFVLWLTGGEAMRQVAAGQLRSVDRGGFRLLNAGKIGFSGLLRAFDNALCYA
ncbi:Uncharacterised protein [Salmonella enterica subsp. enterica serovar Typhi]|nr:Uncharacterised protein [Salmonella enterica subsp. enterica serovar Typhi]CHI50244.1 Uncharacterised protein [Salmonella enterica subsp. enterica serovar Typhi]